MKLKSKNHVYECLPPFMNNRQLPAADQIVIGLKVVPMPEQDLYQREVLQVRSEYALDKAQELIEEKTRKLISSKVAFVRGLEIEGLPPEIDFETFYNEAPPEIVNWVSRAVMSTTELSQAERKNWLPESGSPS